MFKKVVPAIICLALFLTNTLFTMAEHQNIPAPENLTAEILNYSDGTPYFKITFDTPSSLKALAGKEYEYNEAGGNYFIELEFKIGDGSWYSGGSGFSYEAWQNVNLGPEDVGVDGNIDIKANTYH
ncbi:MAG TPA: hypothetical protein PK733_10035, partial [Clostridiales bacterium]|nr:hypothetical protein [Clostridiales bacterium]